MFVHQKNGRTVGQYPGFTILTIVYSIYRFDETVCRSNQPIYHICVNAIVIYCIMLYVKIQHDSILIIYYYSYMLTVYTISTYQLYVVVISYMICILVQEIW